MNQDERCQLAQLMRLYPDSIVVLVKQPDSNGMAYELKPNPDGTDLVRVPILDSPLPDSWNSMSPDEQAGWAETHLI